MNRLLGGILLVTGSCIGAGMLAIPTLTGQAGFLPASTMLLASWLFMLCTGLLLIEVNLACGKHISIVTMAEETLGIWGKRLSWILYIFLFYSLLVAYISESGQLISHTALAYSGISIPHWASSMVFVVHFGFLAYVGTGAVDSFNRLLVLGLAISFAGLLVIGVPQVQPELLEHKDWTFAPWSLPVLILVFGFHNLVPSLTDYFDANPRKLYLSAIIGSLLSLCAYFAWEALILGSLPVEGPNGLAAVFHQQLSAEQVLTSVVSNPWITSLVQGVAFFAIVSSLLGVVLSCVDFLADGLQVDKTPSGKIFLCCLTLIPPYVFVMSYPDAFFQALNLAGGFGAIILFGIIPALMAWSTRYRKCLPTPFRVPGGKLVLVIIILAAIAVFGLELAQELGYSRLTPNMEITS